jgi:hypothetical protein
VLPSAISGESTEALTFSLTHAAARLDDCLGNETWPRSQRLDERINQDTT